MMYVTVQVDKQYCTDLLFSFFLPFLQLSFLFRVSVLFSCGLKRVTHVVYLVVNYESLSVGSKNAFVL